MTARARLLPDDASGRAAAIAELTAGGLVAMPTDTVYGVGVALFAKDGLPRLFAAKDRPLDKAIVLLVADIDQAASVGVLSTAARTLAERFWPGGLTLVLPQRPEAGLAAVLTGGAVTIGVRVPDHDCPRAIATILGPLPVTSANLSGQPDAWDAAGVLDQLGDRIDLILDGGRMRGRIRVGGVPSTVLDCTGKVPRILRVGAVSAVDLVAALQEPGRPQTSRATDVIEPGRSIGRLRLGMTRDEVLAICGDPILVSGPRPEESEGLDFAAVAVALSNGRVSGLIAQEPVGGQTADGIAVGVQWTHLSAVRGEPTYEPEELGLWVDARDPGIGYDIARPLQQGDETIDPPFKGVRGVVTDPEQAFVRRIFVWRVK
jgi:L-threonylcarbamoyladenylate synthase